jgi:chaperonin GroEL
MNEMAGDGTITTTVLASAIYAEGVKNVAAGCNPMHLPCGSQATVDRDLSFPSANNKTINTTAEIAQVTTISMKGDIHVRNLITQATEKVSMEGVITVKEGRSIDGRSRSPKGCGSIVGSSSRVS